MPTESSENHRKLGPVFYFDFPWIGFLLSIADAPSIQHILKTNFDNYPKGDLWPKYGRDIWGHGIFMVDDDEWKYQRKLALPLFSNDSLDQAVHITNKHLDTMIDRCRSSKGTPQFPPPRNQKPIDNSLIFPSYGCF